jgi:hypothetical protein
MQSTGLRRNDVLITTPIVMADAVRARVREEGDEPGRDAHVADPVLALDCRCKQGDGRAKKHRPIGPEGGVTTVRFLVLQHERGRHTVLGPSAIDTESVL